MVSEGLRSACEAVGTVEVSDFERECFPVLRCFGFFEEVGPLSTVMPLVMLPIFCSLGRFVFAEGSSRWIMILADSSCCEVRELLRELRDALRDDGIGGGGIACVAVVGLGGSGGNECVCCYKKIRLVF